MLIYIKKYIDSCLINILMILINMMLFCVCWQVFSRFILQMPATFTEELVRFLLIWVGFLGAAYSFGADRHLSLSLIKDKCSPNVQKILSYITISIIIFISIFLLIYGGFKLIGITWNQKSSVLQIPLGYIYIILPITGIFTMFYKICDLYKLIKEKTS
ncbi:MAG: TRAP transporter small permease [Brevinema sp.]